MITDQTKVVCVAGATATGKTQFALDVAAAALRQGPWPSVSIISADSRQVYSGLEIVTGADVPAGWEQLQLPQFEWPVWQSPTSATWLHGLGVLSPDQEWSLGLFVRWAHQVMQQTWADGGLAVVVGGTGLFLDRLFDPAAQNLVPPNPELRARLSLLSLTELQSQLQQLSQSAWEQLNQSDRHNPRRLVRAIERQSGDGHEETLTTVPAPEQQLWVGLELPLEDLTSRITQRVTQRLAAGALAEVARLRQQFPAESPVFTATGVAQLISHLQGELTLEQAEAAWIVAERQYAKRQITWWRSATLRHPGMVWLAADRADQAVSFRQ